MKNLDVPLKQLTCPVCGLVIDNPKNQIRLSADECGGRTAIIGFHCPLCNDYQSVPDDAEILFETVIEIKDQENL
jgi:hypothetical protein